MTNYDDIVRREDGSTGKVAVKKPFSKFLPTVSIVKCHYSYARLCQFNNRSRIGRLSETTRFVVACRSRSILSQSVFIHQGPLIIKSVSQYNTLISLTQHLPPLYLCPSTTRGCVAQTLVALLLADVYLVFATSIFLIHTTSTTLQ